MDKEKLFEAFPPVTTKQWKDKIEKDLKGADYKRKLVWKTGEGFNVEPFYRSEDIAKYPHMNSLPGNFPFVRGNRVKENSWLVRQDIVVNNIEEANKKALDIRLKGADSIGFVFDNDYKPTTNDIEKLCENIRADVMELNFKSSFPLELVKSFDFLVKKHNRDLGKVTGSVDYDPLGNFSRTGKFYTSEDEDLTLLKELHKASSHLPKFQYITIDASIFNSSGAGIVSELAFSLAMGAEYLTYLTNNSLEIDDIAPKIRFHFSVGSNYFMEIAKFRAAKYLWAKIVNAYGLDNADNAIMHIHCSNSRWNKTVYDPYVNMLRTTTESMSAILGGINSLSVLPFNSTYEKETEFSERIARNQQLILKGESYLDKVADIGAGSYYIESLTDKLITNAWERFIAIDDEGGYIKAIKSGLIQQIVADEAAQKDGDIATRKKSILGVNQYPNSNEHLSDNFKFSQHNAVDKNVESLKPYRGAEKIEKLRFSTDSYSTTNKRPVVWMFTFGNLTMRKARSQFAANFFGCAGFEIVDNPGFSTVEEGINAAKQTNPDIVVICSSDKEYTDIVEPVFEALKQSSIIVVAGYPKDLINKLYEIGLTNLVHVKSNLYSELKRYQELVFKV